VVRATRFNVVRYADNFLVTSQSPRQFKKVKQAINEFLKEQGLQINQKKRTFDPFEKGLIFWAGLSAVIS
jgi:hypothetical protein